MINIFKSPDTGIIYADTLGAGFPEDWIYSRDGDNFSFAKKNSNIPQIVRTPFNEISGKDDSGIIVFLDADSLEQYFILILDEESVFAKKDEVTGGSGISPFISRVGGKLRPTEFGVISIEGENFQPNSVITLEDAEIDNVVIQPNLITLLARCNDLGTHELEIKNGQSSSKNWGDNFVDCVNLPNGVEQRFITGFSAKSQFSTTFAIANAFDGTIDPDNGGSQHFSAGNGQAQDHYIQIDHGQQTLITKLGLIHSANRGSVPFSFQISDDGVTFTEALQITLPPDGSRVDLENVAVVARYTRLVWIDTVDFANAIEYYILGRQ